MVLMVLLVPEQGDRTGLELGKRHLPAYLALHMAGPSRCAVSSENPRDLTGGESTNHNKCVMHQGPTQSVMDHMLFDLLPVDHSVSG
jgi:hypothetical protein